MLRREVSAAPACSAPLFPSEPLPSPRYCDRPASGTRRAACSGRGTILPLPGSHTPLPLRGAGSDARSAGIWRHWRSTREKVNTRQAARWPLRGTLGVSGDLSGLLSKPPLPVPARSLREAGFRVLYPVVRAPYQQPRLPGRAPGGSRGPQGARGPERPLARGPARPAPFPPLSRFPPPPAWVILRLRALRGRNPETPSSTSLQLLAFLQLPSAPSALSRFVALHGVLSPNPVGGVPRASPASPPR